MHRDMAGRRRECRFRGRWPRERALIRGNSLARISRVGPIADNAGRLAGDGNLIYKVTPRAEDDTRKRSIIRVQRAPG